MAGQCSESKGRRQTNVCRGVGRGGSEPRTMKLSQPALTGCRTGDEGGPKHFYSERKPEVYDGSFEAETD